LHVAALNGCTNCVNILLEAGALVHVRDLLDHTSLYYAARQGHEAIVEILVKAGGHLGGSDIAGGFAKQSLNRSLRVGDAVAVGIWKRAGMDVVDD